MRSGGQVLVEHLRLNGTERVFTVPGESFLAVLDALHDASGIDVVVCRHEGAASMMAEATARLAPAGQMAHGVALVSRGPGFANAMSGLHAARQSSTPMLLVVGLPPAGTSGRDSFQEMDIATIGRAAAKHVEIVTDVTRLREALNRALVVAHGGRPGPVIIGIAEDVLATSTDTASVPPLAPVDPGPTYEDMIRLADAIDSAEWPLMIVGGSGWTMDASRQVQRFAERLDLPVIASFRSQDAIDNRSTVYCGHAGLGVAPKLKSALSSADLLLVVGTRIDEITAGHYETIAVPRPRQRIVHVHRATDIIGANHQADIAIVSSPVRFAARLEDLTPSIRPGMPQKWSPLRRDLRAAFDAWQRIPASPGQLRLEDVVTHVSEVLPDDAIVTNGAGNYAAFLHRAFTYKQTGTQLAPISGSMGYGLAAAIAAKLAHPGREVVCFAGDGCFQMTAADLATAVQYGVGVIFLVANNGMLGTIRAAQERRYPGRVVATSLVNPDFAAFARSFGAAGVRATNFDDFKRHLAEARRASVPTVIELMLDRDAIAPGTTISGLSKMPKI